MLSTIRNRLLIILALVGLSGWFLRPRDVTIREQGPDGRMRDTTVRRVPLKLGLDLQGGIHLALEIDESRGAVPDRAGALERALSISAAPQVTRAVLSATAATMPATMFEVPRKFAT